MLTKTQLALGTALAAVLMASALSFATSFAAAQPYDRNYGNGYDRSYDSDRYAREPYNPYTDRGYDERYNDRYDRDRNGYEPPRIPGRTFTANDQPGQRLTGTPGDDVFHAGHNSVIMTGVQGSDRFVFDVEPWNAGHITDFRPGQDILDFRPLFLMSNYRGNNPVRDGYLQFKPSESGRGTDVFFDSDGPANGHPWPIHLTTLDNVLPDQIRANDWLWR